MPQIINVTEEDISYTENILLPKDKQFNVERRNYIKNFETLDLLAVPGSGKTTALLAKLLILESKSPLDSGSGILVLSHTNAAIDEIKRKLNGCTKIFSYPNFIGTIQSFVDTFLAIPFFVQEYKRKPVRIDNEIYDEIASKKFANMPNIGAKNWLNNKFEPEQYFKKLRFDKDWNLKEGIDGSICLLSSSNSSTYRYLKNEKLKILENGFLNYDDAYFFAEQYLIKYPSIKNILQNRFPFVFIDEMQDMDTHQYELIENLFFSNGESSCKIQRIGDKNQAIYNTVKAADVWQERKNVLRLSDSMRLSAPIANVVSKFAIHNGNGFEINGVNISTLKPHILVYENETINQVVPYFSSLVEGFKNEGHLNDFDHHPVKVIAWNTDWEDEEDRINIDKVRLIHYHKSYKKEKIKLKNDFPNLKNYLVNYDPSRSTLGSIRKNILNTVLKILRLENMLFNNERSFTKKLLLNYLKSTNPDQYEEFKLNIFNWSIAIIRGQVDQVAINMREYLPTLSVFNGSDLELSKSFINDEELVMLEENSNDISNNFFQANGFSIEVTSVHAVKGQTHCATLYLESHFHKDGKPPNDKSFESQRLAPQFLGNLLKSNVGERVKQSTKMAFVGFSRPTNLLCIGIHKNRFEQYLSAIDRNIWEIKETPVKF